MKVAKILTKTVFFILLVFNIAVFGSVIYLDNNIADDFKIKKGATLELNSKLPVTAIYNGSELSSEQTNVTHGQFDVNLKMFGVIPFAKASVQVVDEMYVAVLGNPFGMKLYTKGALVIDMADVETENGKQNPAKAAGIEKGDYILSVDGKKITCNEDLIELVENCVGKKLKVEVLKNNRKKVVSLCPVISKESGTYKIGLWVRDSSAGIGTLTFYSPTNNVICGLGHGVCDEDTGKILTLDSGEILSASIFAVEKGKSGAPGQLKGNITNETLGKIKLNCTGGVYSVLTGEISSYQLTEIALKEEVRNGKAQILCTIDGEQPKLFSCKVSVKKSNFGAKTQNMIVTVTDPELLEKTGGIVQGLSGSPLLQNGKLIGAVTHVLVDDPTKGYAIFAENMLETAQSVAEEQQLKDAS